MCVLSVNYYRLFNRDTAGISVVAPEQIQRHVKIYYYYLRFKLQVKFELLSN
jgi:hypothetical protein